MAKDITKLKLGFRIVVTKPGDRHCPRKPCEQIPCDRGKRKNTTTSEYKTRKAFDDQRRQSDPRTRSSQYVPPSTTHERIAELVRRSR
jgi:hypothetical protein